MIKRKPDQDETPEQQAEPDPQEQLAQLQERVEELNNRYLRVLADYQNSQRRATTNEQEARRQGVQDVARSILTVLDHFDLALNQDPAKTTPEQLVSGVRVIRQELFRALQSHGLGAISPDPGDEFQPARHEAITHQQAPGVKPGHIAATLQTGYTLGDRVIRPAKVAVAPTPEDYEPDEQESPDDEHTEP
jgi:molecular chaperone GrpE